MHFSVRPLQWVMAAALVGCAPTGAFDAAHVEQEARAFMEGYATDILNHSAEAIADRYDPRGAYFLGHGRKSLETVESIRTRYTEQWQGPVGFEWHDLSYEVLSADAIVVAGTLSWTTADSIPPLLISYAGLLVRGEEGLRIRLEDESMDLSQARAMAGPTAEADQ